MTALRALVAAAAVGVALILQVTFFPHLAWDGIVPNVCLLVVVGAALTRGPQFAAVLGFATPRHLLPRAAPERVGAAGD